MNNTVTPIDPAFDTFLLALRNDLVTFWGTLVTLHGQAALMPTYNTYCIAADLLDPENPRHMDNVENAITLYRMTIVALSEGVLEYQRNQMLTPNQAVLKIMRRQMTEREERQIEAMHGC